MTIQKTKQNMIHFYFTSGRFVHLRSLIIFFFSFIKPKQKPHTHTHKIASIQTQKTKCTVNQHVHSPLHKTETCHGRAMHCWMWWKKVQCWLTVGRWFRVKMNGASLARDSGVRVHGRDPSCTKAKMKIPTSLDLYVIIGDTKVLHMIQINPGILSQSLCPTTISPLTTTHQHKHINPSHCKLVTSPKHYNLTYKKNIATWQAKKKNNND